MRKTIGFIQQVFVSDNSFAMGFVCAFLIQVTKYYRWSHFADCCGNTYIRKYIAHDEVNRKRDGCFVRLSRKRRFIYISRERDFRDCLSSSREDAFSELRIVVGSINVKYFARENDCTKVDIPTVVVIKEETAIEIVMTNYTP